MYKEADRKIPSGFAAVVDVVQDGLTCFEGFKRISLDPTADGSPLVCHSTEKKFETYGKLSVVDNLFFAANLIDDKFGFIQSGNIFETKSSNLQFVACSLTPLLPLRRK